MIVARVHGWNAQVYNSQIEKPCITHYKQFVIFYDVISKHVHLIHLKHAFDVLISHYNNTFNISLGNSY